MQKVRSLLLAVFLFSSVAQAVFSRPFYDQMNASVVNYFTTSGRKVKKIIFGQPRMFEGSQYIIESAVEAQAAFGSDFIQYHCGTFFHKDLKRAVQGSEWVVDFVTCEVRQ